VLRFGTLIENQRIVERNMAKLALVYGLRLLPEEELAEVQEATVLLKNGKTARVTMHLIEGSKEEIEATFNESVKAFFEFYPEI
jgi:acyl carrier protein phosphodiesterase